MRSDPKLPSVKKRKEQVMALPDIPASELGGKATFPSLCEWDFLLLGRWTLSVRLRRTDSR